jgi:hypothetical protein
VNITSLVANHGCVKKTTVVVYWGEQMVRNMTPEKVIDHFESISSTASALGITYESVRKWVIQGKVPQSRQYEIEILTGGKLKAEPKPKQKVA